MNDFLCPKCRGGLRAGDHIVFRVKNQKKQFGILLLSPEIGNYSSIKHPSFHFETDEQLEFSCPLCHYKLQSEIDERLAHVLMTDAGGEEVNVYFSQISGEHTTYATSGDSLRVAGEHAGRYTYFRIGEKFRKYL